MANSANYHLYIRTALLAALAILQLGSAAFSQSMWNEIQDDVTRDPAFMNMGGTTINFHIPVPHTPGPRQVNQSRSMQEIEAAYRNAVPKPPVFVRGSGANSCSQGIAHEMGANSCSRGIASEPGANSVSHGIAHEMGANSCSHGIANEPGANSVSHGIANEPGANSITHGIASEPGANSISKGIASEQGVNSYVNRASNVYWTPTFTYGRGGYRYVPMYSGSGWGPPSPEQQSPTPVLWMRP